MARFTLPRDIYHGKGCLEELKKSEGKESISRSRRRFYETPGIP